eukprot:TRINITY_DN23651_c0_g1_i1.p1 TRINITY_DN23651_c0_g1~~TRINITY_DN23651_c0_g1_i1.p1  ORF type:complete len:246 (-),score=24.52 TRINITY_DN23651_c0_g1_i1:167-904(-)
MEGKLETPLLSERASGGESEQTCHRLAQVVIVQHAGGGADIGVTPHDLGATMCIRRRSTLPEHANPPAELPLRPWTTGLFECWGGPGTCMQNTEICVLGCLCPSILHGFITEELTGEPCWGNCLLHASLWFLGVFAGGSILCHWGLAPCYSHPTRTALRHHYGIQGSGCRRDSSEDKESCDAMADCCIHYWCHTCALCQEAREINSDMAMEDDEDEKLTWSSLHAPPVQTMSFTRASDLCEDRSH